VKDKWATYLYRSDDGGRTWGAPLLLESTDRQSITIDRSPGSKYRGSVYINATGTTRGITGTSYLPADMRTDLTVLYSRDGVHFNTSKRVQMGSNYVLGMGNGAALSDGSLVFVFGEITNFDGVSEVRRPAPRVPNANLNVITSPDGGATLDAAVKVSDWFMDWPPNSSGVIPYVVADQSEGPFKDRVYVVWPDRRSGRDEIYVAHSADKGKTWSKPVPVNDDRAWAPPAQGPDHLLPVIAVNAQGVVGVAWQDRRDHPDNLGYTVRFSASLDGGDTWLPSVKVSEKPHTVGQNEVWPLMGAGSGAGGILSVNFAYNAFGFSGGHYAGMAVSSDGRFSPTWVDNRTGVPQIWTAPIRVQGAVVKNGSAELAGLDNVADKVQLELTQVRYEAKSGLLSSMASLKNTSKDTIKGPVKVRVVDVRSDLADVKIVGAENGLAGAGALWDFSSVIRGGQLLPDSSSAPRKVTFQLSDVRPFRDGMEFRLSVVNVSARVLAHAVPRDTSATKKETTAPKPQ
jgi:hypothetical protein